MLPLLLAVALSTTPQPGPRFITVSGEARVAFRPNLVIATFLVSASQRDQPSARRAADEKLNKLVQAARAAGVEARGIVVSDLGAAPEYKGNEVTSYLATRSVVLNITELGRVDEALSAAVKAGGVANGTVVLQNTEHQVFESKARLAAASAARERAKGVTEALGAKLGLPVSVTDRTPTVEAINAGGFVVQPDGAVNSSFASRELVVNAQLTVQFDMEAP